MFTIIVDIVYFSFPKLIRKKFPLFPDGSEDDELENFEFRGSNLALQRMYEFYFRRRVENDFVWSPTGFYKVDIFDLLYLT